MAQETPARSRFDPLSVAWRAFAAPQTLLALMGLVSLALALGILLPQIPVAAVGDPQAWLAVRGGRLGPAGDLLLVLGFFDIFHSLWFRLLLILVGLSLFVRAIDTTELAWYSTGLRPWPATPPSSAGSHPPERQLATFLGLDEVEVQLGTLFARMGVRFAGASSSSLLNLVAVRRGWVLWARPLAYAALLLALAGLAITSSWGWQGEEWQPVPGESRALAHDTPYVVRLDTFDLEAGDAGRLQDYSSQITWLEGESEVQQDTIDMGRAATRQGVSVRQVGFVPVVRLRGWDLDGRLLELETAEDALSLLGEVEIRFPSPEARPLVLVPDNDLILALTFEPVCTQGRPALYLEPIQAQSSSPVAPQVLYDSGSILIDGLRFEVDMFFVPVLRADFGPGMGLVVLGLVLFMICASVFWIASPWLAWISVRAGEDEETHLRVQVLPGIGSDRRLWHLARRLEEELSSDD